VSYSVDTSALIDLWVRYYPPDVFDTLWKHLDDLVRKGRLLAVDEVRRELEKKDDELYKWVKARPNMLVPLDQTLQQRGARIINDPRFESLTNTKSVMRGVGRCVRHRARSKAKPDRSSSGEIEAEEATNPRRVQSARRAVHHARRDVPQRGLEGMNSANRSTD